MKRKLKKIIALLTALSLLFFCSCKKETGLYDYVSELRSEIYEGECSLCKLKCFYSYKESPYILDGKIENKEYMLIFKLVDKELSPATYKLELDYDQKTYKDIFKYSNNYNSYVVVFNIENFSEKTFSVKLSRGEKSEDVILKSTIPENTIDYKKALEILENSSKDLIASFSDENGKFIGEIHARIIVKDKKAYWYVGLISETDKKALLIDAKDGKLLAVRTII